MAIDIKNPTVKIPFGKHKGKIFWTTGIVYLRWLLGADITEDTKKSIWEAFDLINNIGSYAVMRRSKQNRFEVRLKTICSSQLLADSYCESDENWEDYVYHIQEPIEEHKHVTF